MPATPTDIAAGTREMAFATWSDAAIQTRYPSARDGSAQPAEGFFASISDAQSVANARAALIGTERRRFAVVVDDVLWIDPALGPPTVTLVDAEQRANGAFLVAQAEVDLEAETTTLTLFG